ncbi:hypothetical protein ACFWF0_36100, partial [Nocardia asteroides]
MRSGRVGGAEDRPVLLDEGVAGGRVVVEGGQYGAQSRSLHPVEHGVLAVQQVDVRRLPDVGGAAGGREVGEVGLGGEDGAVVAQDVRETVPPAPGVGEFAHQAVAGGVEVAGHLEGEGAAGGEPVDPVGEAVDVAGDPLEGGVADEEAEGLVGGPGAGVGGGEAEVAAAGGGAGVLPGPVVDLLRVVVAGDSGVV